MTKSNPLENCDCSDEWTYPDENPLYWKCVNCGCRVTTKIEAHNGVKDHSAPTPGMAAGESEAIG